MADLTALLERVKAATGPDMMLDADLWAAFVPMLPVGSTCTLDIRITSSLDAALALVERVLPGPSPHLWRFRGCGWGARLDADDDYGTVLAMHTYSPSPALALLAALLLALASGDVGSASLSGETK